jgi:hypothetical protein
MRAAVGLAALVALLGAAPARAQEGVCTGAPFASGVEMKEGPLMRFGITPSGAAGQVGLPARAEPDRIDAMLAKLDLLKPPGGPFVAHVYSSWESAGAAEDARVKRLADAYSVNGFEVEVVLRFKPPAGHEDDVAGYLGWVRHMVALLGPNPRLVALQIANEVNFTLSPDSSDGAYPAAREALVQGVIAARREADRLGHRHVEVGFNWLYRMDTASERSFWEYLRDRGGPEFVAALGWVGLDAYPGTFFPPAVPPGGERDWVVNALDLLRRCYLPTARIPFETPIHVQENGFPTGPGRSYERQVQALRTMVRAFHDYRGTFNVSDYRWFNLRDADTESAGFQQQYGLVKDDYDVKPAFEAYRTLVRELSRATEPVAREERRPRLRYRCGKRLLLLDLRAAGDAVAVAFFRGRRRLAVDTAPPFRRRISRDRVRRGTRVRAEIEYPGSQVVTVHGPRVRRCAGR